MFHRILAPLDGSALAECVLPHVIAFAKAFDAHVSLLRVLEHHNSEPAALDPIAWQIGKVEAKAYLDTISRQLQENGLTTDTVLLEGRAADAVVNYVHDDGIDLIVLSSHGASGLSAWNISGAAQKMIQRVNCSVLLLRAYLPTEILYEATQQTRHFAELRYQQILLPLDGSLRAEYVLSPAQRLSRYHNAECTLIHVIQRPVMPRRVPLTPVEQDLVERIVACNEKKAEAYFADLQHRLDGNCHTRILVEDDVTETLHSITETEQVDLVILTAHGYSGKRRWPYGAITSSFILHGTTPLLFVQDLAQDECSVSQAERMASEQSGHGHLDRALAREEPPEFAIHGIWN